MILVTVGYFGMIESIENSGFFRVIITSLFGLIHGFGFGAFLFNSEFNQSNILSALFGFNLGVEIGQIIFLLFLIGITTFLVKIMSSEKYEYLMKTSMILVSSLGFYWFIQRLYFWLIYWIKRIKVKIITIADNGTRIFKNQYGVAFWLYK